MNKKHNPTTEQSQPETDQHPAAGEPPTHKLGKGVELSGGGKQAYNPVNHDPYGTEDDVTLPPGLQRVRERAERIQKLYLDGNLNAMSGITYGESYNLLDLIETLAGALEDTLTDCACDLCKTARAALDEYRRFS